MEGPGRLGNMKTYHVSADLSEYLPGDALITHVIRPGGRFRRTTIRPQGPSWGRHCEEWGIGVAFRPGDVQEVSDADAPDVIREALDLPDLPIKLHIGYDWSVERVVADLEARADLSRVRRHRARPVLRG
jgi:2,4-dichlorophenol 6-monooxygenase